ncbi:50S ribosomal protein L7Ae [Candidatus Tiddalikarchaeum anstoanum]|nr:50S ribosomal protein L7Ae [Candidatus Tiddalikarchaeum anstoanum]
MVSYVTFEVPDDIQQKVLEVFAVAKNSGKVKKGTNEVTKAIERGIAKLVIIAKDVEPPEIVMHLPALCDEKGISYIFVKNKKYVGEAVGVTVPTASAVILDAGEGKNALIEVKEKIATYKKK